MRVEIYSRPDCGLCEEAKHVLKEVQQTIEFTLVEVNIEDDPQLLSRYRYDIPVVFIDGHKAFKHRVDRSGLLERLTRGTAVAQSKSGSAG